MPDQPSQSDADDLRESAAEIGVDSYQGRGEGK